MNVPLFPNFKPKLILPVFFEVDQPCDDEDEVSQLERDHQNWVFELIFSYFVKFSLIVLSVAESDIHI